MNFCTITFFIITNKGCSKFMNFELKVCELLIKSSINLGELVKKSFLINICLKLTENKMKLIN